LNSYGAVTRCDDRAAFSGAMKTLGFWWMIPVRSMQKGTPQRGIHCNFKP
jgi:hypothetical protein